MGTNNEELLYASRNGDINEVINLIQTGADVNVKDGRGYTPLHMAAMQDVGQGNINFVTGKTEPPDDKAIETNFEIAKLLIENGANVNVKDNEGDTPLFHARRHLNFKVASLIVEHGGT